MTTGWGRRLLLAAVIGVTAASAALTDARGADERLDQACAVEKLEAWADFTEAQTVTPTVSQITGWEVRVLVVDQFEGALTSRLVYHPAADAKAATNGLDVGTEVLATASASVRGGRFHRQWLRFTPDQPIAVPTSPASARGVITIDVDFPLDFDYVDPATGASGAHIAWMVCGVDYEAGQAQGVVSPDAQNRNFQACNASTKCADPPTGAYPTAPNGLPAAPAAYVPHTRATDFQFRLYGR